MKPVVIIQMKRVETRLCHSGTVPKPSSICTYGDMPPFEQLSALEDDMVHNGIPMRWDIFPGEGDRDGALLISHKSPHVVRARYFPHTVAMSLDYQQLLETV
jgi:hypothetical protein